MLIFTAKLDNFTNLITELITKLAT